eukprot:15002347-Ditylum_brightwellii.AAC.1
MANEGLGTGLKPENMEKFGTKGSENLEKCLHHIETILAETLRNTPLAKESTKSKDFKTLFNNLQQDEDKIVVPTDKMNNYKVVNKELYTQWV